MSIMRKSETDTVAYRFYADRVHRYFCIPNHLIISILVEEGVCELPGTEVDIKTPCGVYKGIEYPQNFCAVSIMRSGDALLQAFMESFPSAPIGKVLIQRDESSPDKCARVLLQHTIALTIVLLQQASKGYRKYVRVHL